MALRLAMLAAALAAAVPAVAQKPSPDRTTIEADNIEAVSDLEVSARGNAEIQRDDITIFGESLRYNRELGRTEGEGGVRLQRGADRFFGPRLQYNTLDDTGVFENPSYLLQHDRTARGSADRIEFLGREHYRMSNANYTTCQPGDEDWRLEASEIELDFDEEEGTARGMRLRFFDTTVLASPWAIFPIGGRRKSGLLAPYYSQSSSRGFEFGLPYYWNIAPEYDVTFTPVVMSRRGFQLKTQGRYLNRDFGGELKVELLPDDTVAETSREGVSWQHQHRLWSGGTAQIDYNKVSDDRYFVDLSSKVRQSSQGNLPQDALVVQQGLLGRASYTAQARVQKFQTLQDPLSPIVPPYHREPQLNFNPAYNNMGGFLDGGLPLEYVRFTHPTLVEGARSTVAPVFAAPILAPGWFITPKVGVRYVTYNLDHVAPGAEAPAVTVPWGSFDAGLVFDRPTSLLGAGSIMTLEPRFYYVNVPFRNQDAIPVFDTALADFNYMQIFSENRFVGGDRFGDAKQSTLALTSRLLQASGQEALRATLAQRYYYEPERVGLTSTSTLRTSTDSDILASIGGRFTRSFGFDATVQYDRHEDRAQKYSVAMKYAPEAAKVLNFSYRFNREQLKQIDVSTQWPLLPGWYGVARYNYSLLDQKVLDGVAGIEYNAGCWVFRAVVQRVQTATQVSSTSFIFQIEFNGIGSVGTNEATEILRRQVPGYSVTNPADPRIAPPSAQPQLPFEQAY